MTTTGQSSSMVDPYEAESARRLGVEHAVAFGFARHGLRAWLECAGAKPGDEVVLSPLTCKVVPLTLMSAGLTPVYADISRDSMNLDPEHVRTVLSSRTGAVLFQHTYGLTAGFEDVTAVARQHGVPVVQDGAQCLPTTRDDSRPGHSWDAAVFSNNLLKPLPAGSGGLVTTNDADLARRIRRLRDALPAEGPVSALAGRVTSRVVRHLLGPRTYWTALTAFSQLDATYRDLPAPEEIDRHVTNTAYRPGAVRLAEGLRWVRRIDAVAAQRRACCAHYHDTLLARAPSLTLRAAAGDRPLLYYPLLTDQKTKVLARARARHRQVVAWPGRTPMYPVQRFEALRRYGYTPGSCPAAEGMAERLLGLPTDPGITATHRARLLELILESIES